MNHGSALNDAVSIPERLVNGRRNFARAVNVEQWLLSAGRGSASTFTVPQRLVKLLARGSSSGVSAPQRLVKPVRDLLDVVSIPCKLAKAGRHSASAVFIPQQLLMDVSSFCKCS